MIDLHAHILHDVDDGPETLAEALEIIRLASRQGITHMIATPHFKYPLYLNKRVAQSYEELKKALEASSLEVKVDLGNEIYLSEESVAAVDEKNALTLADSNYLLIELPREGIFSAHEQMIYELQLKNYQIILAHVERYGYMMKKPELLHRFVCSGCYGQITASAIVNFKTRKMAYALIEQGLIHFVATDCHDAKARAPILLEAYEKVLCSFGEDLARSLFHDHAQSILYNSVIKNGPGG